MKIYQNKTVFTAAIERLEYLFSEFEDVVVGISGGKDSTIVLNLALQVAEKLNRLPLRVMFIDQEAEYQATIDYLRIVAQDKRIDMHWYQMPIRIFNATTKIPEQQWLQCWKPGEEWMRPKEPGAITENIYGTDRFHELFAAIMDKELPGKACYIAGVRTEESPTRFIGLTSAVTYKWITWGKLLNKKKLQYTLYPIYDWSYTDVWKAIFSNGWHYNKIYDAMYRYGVPPVKMRVSNLHHETAVQSLFMLQEIEPETYQKLTNRISGIDTAGKLGKDDFFVKELPFMFTSWFEYRDFLLDKLITDPKIQARLRKTFKKQDDFYCVKGEMGEEVPKMHVQSIITNDIDLTKIMNWLHRPKTHDVRKKVRLKYNIKGVTT